MTASPALTNSSADPAAADRRVPARGRFAMDAAFGKVFRNFRTVLTGQVAVTAMGFAALTLNARALDVHGIGILFLIQATCELTSKVLAFQNWQTVVKFGAEAVRAGDPERLRAIWRFGFMLDALAALAAALIAAGLMLFAPRLVGLDPVYGTIGLFYAASLILSGSGASIGALRLLDRFGLVVAANVASAALLLVNAAVLWLLDAPLWVYLVTIPAIGAALSIYLNIAGYVRTRQAAEALAGHESSSLDRRAYFRFALGVSAIGTLNALRQRAELLAVGAILGPTAAAFYGVAYRLAALMDRVGESARQSVYPVLSQQVADGDFDKAAALSFRLSKIGLALCVPGLAVLILFGGDVLSLVFGAEFEAARSNLILLGIGASMYLITFPLGPLIQIAMGAGRFLLITAISTAAFAIVGVLGPWLYGQAGAGAGAAAFGIVLASLSLGQVILRVRSSISEKEGVPSSHQTA